MGFGVLFWAWYLVDEAKRVKGMRKKRWYDKKIWGRDDEKI